MTCILLTFSWASSLSLYNQNITSNQNLNADRWHISISFLVIHHSLYISHFCEAQPCISYLLTVSTEGQLTRYQFKSKCIYFNHTFSLLISISCCFTALFNWFIASVIKNVKYWNTSDKCIFHFLSVTHFVLKIQRWRPSYLYLPRANTGVQPDAHAMMCTCTQL